MFFRRQEYSCLFNEPKGRFSLLCYVQPSRPVAALLKGASSRRHSCGYTNQRTGYIFVCVYIYMYVSVRIYVYIYMYIRRPPLGGHRTVRRMFAICILYASGPVFCSLCSAVVCVQSLPVPVSASSSSAIGNLRSLPSFLVSCCSPR